MTKVVGRRYCRLQMLLGLAVVVRERAAWHRLGPWRGLPPSNASLGLPLPHPPTIVRPRSFGRAFPERNKEGAAIVIVQDTTGSWHDA